MKAIFFSLLIIFALTFIQPPLENFVQHITPIHTPLINLIPILITYWAFRLKDSTIIFLTLVCGFFSDLLIPDSFGFGPFTFALTAFIVRTQRILLNSYGLSYQIVLTFAASFLYLSLNRLAFLALHGYWAWDILASLQILTASLLNAILVPIIFPLLKPVLETKPQNLILNNVHP